MNKKFVWTIKHTIYCCLFSMVLLVIALCIGNDKFIRHFAVPTVYACVVCMLPIHLIRIKVLGITDNESHLTNKQIWFIFSLLVLAIILIKLLVADKLLSVILICTLALSSGIFALVYVIKTIRQNKQREIKKQ